MWLAWRQARAQALVAAAATAAVACILVATRAHVAPVAEGGPQPLAPVEHEVAEGGEGRGQLLVHRGPPLELGVQHLPQAPVDRPGHGDQSGGHGHVLTLWAVRYGRTAMADLGSGRVRIQYKVKPGDTLHAIAARYRTTVHELMSWNNLSGSLLAAGNLLTVYTRP